MTPRATAAFAFLAMLNAAPPPPPVSFQRDVAPILAMRCTGCHGEAGGLSTRTYAALMAGGDLGKVVLPGNGEGSLLVAYLDGRRGAKRRMPIGGRPLAPEQIATIRRWIDEGAREDTAALPVYRRRLDEVALPRGRVLEVSAEVATEAFLILSVREPRTGALLLERLGGVRTEKEDIDFGSPRERLVWEVRSGTGWPAAVIIELQVEYARGDPGPIPFVARIR